MPKSHMIEISCGRGQDSNTIFLLARVEALEARCLTLENIVSTGTPLFVQQNVPATNVDTLSYTFVPSPTLSNHDFNAAEDPNTNSFRLMDLPGRAMNANIDPGDMQLSLDQFLAGQPVASIGQPTLDEDFQNSFNLQASIFPSDPSTPGPITRGANLESTTLDNSGPVADWSSSNLVALAPVTNLHPSVHQCQYCMKSFSRISDVRRHSRSHNPNAPRFFCSNTNCNRQFLRMDKLKDHRTRKNH